MWRIKYLYEEVTVKIELKANKEVPMPKLRGSTMQANKRAGTKVWRKGMGLECVRQRKRLLWPEESWQKGEWPWMGWER